MRTTDLRIGVSGPTGLEEAELAASLHLPDKLPGGAPLELLVCLHGGGYTRGYWHPAFVAFPGYSFAEHMTARGYAVLAIDLLGMGESTRPEPEALLSRAIVAAANHVATRTVADGLQDGRWARAECVTVTGIGHSIGGMVAITQAATHCSFQRLAVLGWTNQRMILGDADPVALAGSIGPGYLATPRPLMRALFYAPDVPAALIEADEAAGSTTPSCLGRDGLLPGIVSDAAGAIETPVFLMHGSTDTSPDPHGEVPFFRRSPDVTLMVLPDTAHSHNFAVLRHRLWDRIDRWVRSCPVPHGGAGKTVEAGRPSQGRSMAA